MEITQRTYVVLMHSKLQTTSAPTVTGKSKSKPKYTSNYITRTVP